MLLNTFSIYLLPDIITCLLKSFLCSRPNIGKIIHLLNAVTLKTNKENLSSGALITVVGLDGKPTQVPASSLGQRGGVIGGATNSSLGGAGISYIYAYCLSELGLNILRMD